jgi:hypothetical protein
LFSGKPQSGELISEMRFEPRTSRPQRSGKHLATIFSGIILVSSQNCYWLKLSGQPIGPQEVQRNLEDKIMKIKKQSES